MRWPSCRTLLVLSLVFNVFLLGGIGGALYRWLGDEHAILAQRNRNLRFAADGLPAAYKQAFAAMLKAQRQEAKPLAQAARDGRRSVAQLLVAPGFDRAAIDAALARTREADFEQRRRLEESIVGFAEALPPAERAGLAQGLQRRGSFQLPAPASTAQTSH
ncbi:periplasmic heavy metal sensor [Burkholderia plantarii]|uniref:periplasmic heavy metal sensor n=1 Tax=Burkholderia plantarii TaxID=41899 RepID=UPI0008707070|nr:periplasmic heavy metal sensor [Burkholderia plantarii]WLE63579.1 periplasmic heavy metal sensor [Burkholderia plantarii]